MASVEVLAAAVKTLFGSTFPVYTQVPPGADLPWVFISATLPGVKERSLARTSLLNCTTVRVRLVGANDAAVRQMADIIFPLLEGVRPVAANWRTTGLELKGDPRVDEDYDTTITATGTHPIVGYSDWEFTASPTA